jgi:histidinol-phosphate aminotransferase
MSILNLARPELLALKGYSSARMEAGAAAIMLNANEAPQALVDLPSGAAINRYPLPQPPELVAALAKRYGVRDAQLLVSRGSDEAIDLLIRAFCRAGQDAIAICPPTFGMYQVCAAVQGASVQSLPLDAQADFALDFAQLEAAVTVQTKLVFLCSPNNPTGGVLPRAQILDFVQRMAGRALVVVDEAYVEYSEAGSLSDALDAHPNLAILRTLSKAFALAGARIGCLIADPQVIGLRRKIMAPYPLPQPCVDAALLALQRAAAVDAWVSCTRAERERVHASLRLNPAVLQVWPSQGNFLAFRVADATQTWHALAQRGVVVRDVSHYLGLAGSLRVSIGTPAENDAFLVALREIS